MITLVTGGLLGPVLLTDGLLSAPPPASSVVIRGLGTGGPLVTDGFGRHLPALSTFAQAVNYNDLLPPITLAVRHDAGASTLVLKPAGAGARLGTLGANRIFRVTALKSPGTAAEEVLGIFEATDLVGDTLQHVSGAERFGNVALPAGTAIEVRPTAKDFEEHSVAINDIEAAIPLRALDANVVHMSGDEVIGGRKSFPGSIEGVLFNGFVGGTYILMPSTGASGIGVSSSNPFAAYCHEDAQWLFDSHAGDFATRNTMGSILYGTAVGNTTFAIVPGGVVVNGSLGFGPLGGPVLAAVRPDGSWQPPHLADSAAANDSLYYSTTQGKLCYKDSGGVSHPLYP